MTEAIRQRVTVQPGGRIEIIAPQLKAGSQAEVSILEGRAERRRLAELIGQARGSFASPGEADAFVREERDRWS